jgi:hypothetical protein
VVEIVRIVASKAKDLRLQRRLDKCLMLSCQVCRRTLPKPDDFCSEPQHAFVSEEWIANREVALETERGSDRDHVGCINPHGECLPWQFNRCSPVAKQDTFDQFRRPDRDQPASHAPSGDRDSRRRCRRGCAHSELALLQRQCGTEFRAAFRCAFVSLTPRDRNLIRPHIVDRLAIDGIAMRYGIHRATAARRLAQARGTLIKRLLRELQGACSSSERSSMACSRSSRASSSSACACS